MPQPIDLYFWPTPNGLKISIALEEMELPYVVKPVNIGKGDQFRPDFIKISPNNRMPAIVDPDGPDGKPISVFESGAILQYLGRKTGKFYGKNERERIAVDEWLMWQMANLGPNTGQAGHFRNMAPRLAETPAAAEYGKLRYTNEVNRLYGVMNTRLKEVEFLAGDYSIADMATWPWTRNYANLDQNLDDFPHMKRWWDAMQARPGVQRGVAVGNDLRPPQGAQQQQDNSPEAQEMRKMMFFQTAKSVAEMVERFKS